VPRLLIQLRRVLIYTHRWLGIAGCLLFISWFASGIVMMYARMPELSAAERARRTPPIDLTHARVPLADAAAGHDVERAIVTMVGGRPVYRLNSGSAMITVFADTGERLGTITADRAMDIARRFAPEHAGTMRYDARLDVPDQWTLSGESRRAMPLHRIALGDTGASFVYVSERTGEPVMWTDARTRRWAYAGAVMHWIYFTPLRRQSALWAQLIIWLSIVGCVLCLSGLVWGVWRYSFHDRYRLKRQRAHSPYAGLMKWHHYAGLIFGAATFTWIFSGLLSMNPWDWSPETSPSRLQQRAVAGGPLRLDAITIERLREASRAHASQLEILQFNGKPFISAGESPVSFTRDALVEAARRAVPDAPIADVAWLDDYDAYYYDRNGGLPLPVVRVRFDDPQRTSLYLDARRGAIVRSDVRLTRINRWLYHGLHSLDFPFLYYRRPLWDLVVIVLSAGGIVLSATTISAALHRLRRHARRLRRQGDRYAIHRSVRSRSLDVDRRASGVSGDV